MAEIYLARHGNLVGLRTLVVVKRILPQLARNPQFVEMFLDEARISAAVDHPNVVRIFEVGSAEGTYFQAMELIQGESVSRIVSLLRDRQQLMPKIVAVSVAAAAAAGLHHAHTLEDAGGTPLGIVHRDVSPQNILVSFQGAVKVIDFGIAKARGRLGNRQAGNLRGKVSYLSPEQVRNQSPDPRSDVFALGVVLWEMLTGERLFAGQTDKDILIAILRGPIPPVSDFRPVQPALERIVRKALARDPAKKVPVCRRP